MAGPILIVGQSGQLATDLLAVAGREGHDALSLGRPRLDLTDTSAPARILDRVEPRVVINAAAYTQVDRAESEADLAYTVNRDGPARLASACARAGVPLIHISTDQVFNGQKSGGYLETDAPDPLCVYGASKLAGERAVLLAMPEALILRVSWVFGPSGDNFVTKVLGWARARPKLSIVADQIGRPTYSPALANMLLMLAMQMAEAKAGTPSGLLHLAGGTVLSRAQQAQMILAASRARGGAFAEVEPVPTSAFPTPATRPLNAELDCTLASTRYGLRLNPFADDLDATLDDLIGPRITPKGDI
jgi:dTDP-4-dehydrorhamnose reductase